MRTVLYLGLLWLTSTQVIAQTTTLIAHGDVWRFSDKGVSPANQTVTGINYTWKDLGYNDSNAADWTTGVSELGYGDGDEATVVSFGPDGNNKYITTYFRKTISNSNVQTYYRYKVRYKRDDGIVLYLNGTEIRRDGMPSGSISNASLATAALGGSDESNWNEFYLPNGGFQAGNNVVAAEVHQVNSASSDLTFDLELIAEANPNILTSVLLPVTSTPTTNWKYADNGVDLGTSWQSLSYDDTYWQQTNIGSATRNRMGYGETSDPNATNPDPASTNPFNASSYTNYISFGLKPDAKIRTTYFRKKINIPDILSNPGYELRFMRDDGIVIYINGVELPRDQNGNNNNMPSGPASFTTLAVSSIDPAAETTWSAWQSISTNLLQNGDNLIAVEVHQSHPGSSDMTFNMEVRVQNSASLTRGPYLQMGTQTAASIRWRTDVANIGQVTYGLSPGNLTNVVSETAATTEHEIRLTGLTPDSQYYYSVGTPNQILQQGIDNYFLTAPPADTKRKIRVASFGDSGQNPNNNQTNVRDAFLNFRGNTLTDLWMLVGDNSYDGDDAMYQYNFFEPYQTTLMKNSMMFSIPGNHDYNNNSTLAANHNIPYFSIFSLPTQAEAGGVPSGTKEWYSVDYGPIHFVMLDGYGQRTVNGSSVRLYADTVNHPQVAWLKQDLAATTKKWKIVYIHFPSYTRGGGHNSETEPDLIGIRQRISPILERFGVDMVVTGHSHNYERSYPLHDQYGPMSDYKANSATYRFPDDTGTGRYDGSTNSCPYKNTSEKKKQGTVYVVAGSSGALSSSGLSQHPVMAYEDRQKGGLLYFEVEDNRLDAKFIQPGSPYSIGDQFTILKDVEKPQTLVLSGSQSVTLSASFISDYHWSDPNNAAFSSSDRSVVVSGPLGTESTYVVHDSKNCVQDVFKVIYGQKMYTVKPGSWNDPTAWSGNRIPGNNDVLQLKHVITIPDNTVAQALRLDYDAGITLQYGIGSQLMLGQ